MPRQVKKAYIQNKWTGQILTFQYNPPEFEDSHMVNYAPLTSPGMSYPMFQYVGGEVRRVTFELFLDAREDPTRSLVKKHIAFLHDFIPRANSGKAFTPPAIMVFAFGWFVKNCLLEDMKIRYEMFDEELNPIRATVQLTLAVIQ